MGQRRRRPSNSRIRGRPDSTRLPGAPGFQGLLDSAPDAMIVSQQNGRILMANAQAATLFGYSADELLGECVDTLVPLRLRQRHLASRAAYTASPSTRLMGTPLSLQVALRKDGHEFPAEISLSPLRADGGLLVVSSIRDVSERQRAEETLRTYARQQAAVGELARCALAGKDAEAFLAQAVKLVARALGVECVAVLERSSDHRTLLVRAGTGWRAGVVGRATVPASRHADTQGSSARLSELLASPLFREHGLAAGLSILVPSGEPGPAILGAYARLARSFSADDRRFLRAISLIIAGALKQRRDATARLQLTRRLASARDDERRRLARELHEGTAQRLAALAMWLASLAPGEARLAAKDKRVLGEARALARQCLGEIRSLAVALHPPLLDEAGLLAALHWLQGDVAKRMGVRVTVKARGDLARLPARAAAVLFQTARESLDHIHREGRSRTATASVVASRDSIVIEVSGDGRSLRPVSDPSLGLLGARESVQDLGGSLEVRDGPRGAAVRATLPILSRRSRQARRETE